MVVEKWLDAGRTDRPIDERTARIIEEFERDGHQSQTTVDSRGHRQMRFSRYVPESAGSCYRFLANRGLFPNRNPLAKPHRGD